MTDIVKTTKPTTTGIGRREFVCAVASVAVVLPQSSWAARNAPTIMHVIRIKLSEGIDAPLRAQLLASVYRFRQIRAPSTFVVGSDMAPAGARAYDVAQLSLLQGVQKYHEYYYDPIHLAADREAETARGNPFAAVSAFDTVSPDDAAVAAQLRKIGEQRDAKFRASDTRPTSPPVADRPEDRKWNHGERIYHVLRFNLSGMNAAQRAKRLTAMQRCAAARGVEQLVVGANSSRTPADHYTHAMLVVLENPDAYGRFLTDPLFQAERAAGGTLAPSNVEWFDVIDPDAAGLGQRLRAMHA